MTYLSRCRNHATCGHYSDVDVYFRDGSELSLCVACADVYYLYPDILQFVPQHGGDCNQPTHWSGKPHGPLVVCTAESPCPGCP